MKDNTAISPHLEIKQMGRGRGVKSPGKGQRYDRYILYKQFKI